MLPQLEPFDEENQRLKSFVRPDNWSNPTPPGRYNLIVIGGGTAGLVTAAVAAGLGARTALIEKELMGGDCLNVGCVPSKSLIHTSRKLALIKKEFETAQSPLLGNNPLPQFDFGQVMQKMREVRATIAPHDSAQRFRDLGVDVYFGEAKFHSRREIEVDGQRLQFRKACLAVGTSPLVPNIEGLEDTGYLTNESVFSMTELPSRIALIGGGPIGCELAQCFQRLGSQVSILERSDQILPNEDREAADMIQQALVSDGVQVLTNYELAQVSAMPDGKRLIGQNSKRSSVAQNRLTVDEIIIATGRKPNVDGLALEMAGVEFDAVAGINVDDSLRTTNRHIYAAGDVATNQRFTHAADFMARIVVQNALFPGWRKKFSKLIIPRSIYTSPEIAQVGLTELQARENNINYDKYELNLADNDRAIVQEETLGQVKAITQKGSDRILGATIVGSQASELIGYFSMAMANRLGLSSLGKSIIPYPTVSDAVRRLGDLYSKSKLTTFKKHLLTKWFGWFR